MVPARCTSERKAFRAVFVDATDTLAAIAERQLKAGDPAIAINRQPTIMPPELVDEEAMVEALRSGHIRHAGLDVYATEPLPAGHVLTTLENVTLSAHSAFRTPEASENLIRIALDHCRRIATASK